MLNLQIFQEAELPELMSWFQDRVSCQIWGGPKFRYPFTAGTFREDAKLRELASWSLVNGDGNERAARLYSRLGFVARP